MSNYELGKDIQELKMRIIQIEKVLERNAGNLSKSKCCAQVTKKGNRLASAAPGDPIIYTWGRSDAGECECREATLTIYPDGEYKVVSVHHNHSNKYGPDDGDTHALSYIVRAGGDLVESFGGDRFVPKQEDRPLNFGGNSEALKRRFEAIDDADQNLSCR